MFAALLFCSSLFAQDDSARQNLDHAVQFQRLQALDEQAFFEVLKIYDSYLANHSEDVSIQVEKCRFIQRVIYREYDDYDGYVDYNSKQIILDSLNSQLRKTFPGEPETFFYLTEDAWGDDLQALIDTALILSETNSDKWSSQQLGELCQKSAQSYYYSENLSMAFEQMQRAIRNDSVHFSTILNAAILIDSGSDSLAKKALFSMPDTITAPQTLSRKATYLLALKEYDAAMKVYEQLNEIDSSYIQKADIASTLEGLGEYDKARKYFVADTAVNWQKEDRKKRLFLHDLRHQPSDSCVASYNAYRDLGYEVDPMLAYRLQLFLKHPLTPWKFRDLVGLLIALLIFVIAILVPFTWILPIHFLGHRMRWFSLEKLHATKWGLKSFWWVSSAYLVATLIGLYAMPESLNIFSETDGFELISEAESAFSNVLFFCVFAVLGFATLRKTGLEPLLPSKWTLVRTLSIVIGTFLVFKIASGMYIRIGSDVFDIDPTQLLTITQPIFSIGTEIQGLITNYGFLTTLFLVAFLVPLYEEVIFRGVILDACTRYFNVRTAMVIQAALFGLVHENLFLFPVYFVMGLIGGRLTTQSGSLFASIIFHILNNLLAVFVLHQRM